MCHLEKISDNCGRLESLEGVLENIRILRKAPDKIGRVVLCKERKVGVEEFLGGNTRLALDRTKAGMRILEIRPSITLEGSHPCHIEGVVIDSIVC